MTEDYLTVGQLRAELIDAPGSRDHRLDPHDDLSTKRQCGKPRHIHPNPQTAQTTARGRAHGSQAR